jgi:hypothetical protein
VPVVPTSFHDFFNGCASVAGALIGLLFVAVSISPEKLTGDVGTILAGAGLATTSALVIVLYREHQQQIRHDVRMLAILFVLYGLQLANAVQLDGSPGSVSGIDRQGGLAILFFLFGIARSWQLVGARAIGLATAVATVIQPPPSQGRPRGGGDAAAGGEPGREPGDP